MAQLFIAMAAEALLVLTENRVMRWLPHVPIDDKNKNCVLHDFTNEQLYNWTRFTKNQMEELAEALGIPLDPLDEAYYNYCDNGVKYPKIHGLILVLYMLRMPLNLNQVQERFGREYSQLSRINKDWSAGLRSLTRERCVATYTSMKTASNSTTTVSILS